MVISSGLPALSVGRTPEDLGADAPGLADDRPIAYLRRPGVGLGLGTALAGSLLLAWGLGRVAFWLDEGATVVATQRTWSQLGTLMSGAEAPLVPFYVLMKIFVGVGQHLPGLGSHPEILFRLPSVIVTVLAGWALISWLGRRLPLHAVVATAAMLLLTGGFSRYGQEARPYAAVLSLAVISTIVWARLVTDRRRRWLVLYAVAIAVLTALHTLGALLVGAHLLAALVAPEPGQRRSALVRTLIAAVPGLAVVSPLALITAQNGTGPIYFFPDLTFPLATTVFARVFSYGEHSFLVVGPIVLLGLIGLVQVRSPEYRFVARLAACWALVPLAGLVVVVLVYPNLLFGRYVLYVVPAWAVLAGLGVMTLADLARNAVARVSRSGPALTGVTVAVTVALIAGTAVNQAWTLTQIRTPGGHGEDVRPSLATADRPEYAELPILVSSQFGSIQVATYRRATEQRVVGLDFQRDQSAIWPAKTSAATVKQFLQRQTRVILFQRSTGRSADCVETQPLTPAPQIESCMPKVLRQLNYRVTKVEPSGYGWAFAVLSR